MKKYNETKLNQIIQKFRNIQQRTIDRVVLTEEEKRLRDISVTYGFVNGAKKILDGKA
jgi:hypothetical protein